MAAFLHVDLVAVSLISPGPEINYSNAMVIFFSYLKLFVLSRNYTVALIIPERYSGISLQLIYNVILQLNRESGA